MPRKTPSVPTPTPVRGKAEPIVATESAMPRTLVLGCGRRKIEGAVNLDVTTATDPDVVHDLNVRPWPFPDGHFDRVVAHDVIEHLPDTIKTFEEIHRICRNGAKIEITVPHFSHANAYTDPTHIRYFGVRSFDYFDDAHGLGFYTAARFAKRRVELVFEPRTVNRLVGKLARRNPEQYERRWCWIFPAWYLVVDLEVRK